MPKRPLATFICCHDDWYYLALTIRSFKAPGPVVVFVSRFAWDGSHGDFQRCVEAAEAEGAEVVLGNWRSESQHRRAAMRQMRLRGYRYCFIPDSDEPIEAKLLKTLVGLAMAGTASRVHVHMDTYFKSPEYVVRPREALTPAILIDLETTHHQTIREFSGGTKLVLGPEFGVIHHLSYSGPTERILRKISTWGHKHEVVDGWYENKYLASFGDPTLRDLHPTHPGAYNRLERISRPELLQSIELGAREAIEPSCPWPTVSFVIPLHGGETDIRRNLDALGAMVDLVHETIVVDDKSPDGAAAVAEGFEGVILIRNERNLGFAATSNAGYRASSGQVVVFLNSDAVMTRPGLIRLVESLMASRQIAAAGPYSNHTGHHQQIASTYETLETMPLFAEDLAQTDWEDEDVDMLVGFCLAVKKEVLEDIGTFDERFGIGMFEDNDMCYRMRRAGYRLILSRRAFVHHEGSKSLARRKEHPATLLARNEAIYRAKWRADLECGFVTHLSGTSAEPIVFNPKGKPEEIDKRIRKLAKRANVSLCMIVKNEERILADCLSSVMNGVMQMVVLDTGSTDLTMEIARSYGAEVHEMVWPNSFSEARNCSLTYAKCPWILWMDADDTISRQSLERALLAVIAAHKEVGGFVIPVRFVDQGPFGGTQVDHVKLFRAQPGIAFEGHIHEQVLPSIRRAGKEVVRIKDAYVDHTNYDTSLEGQRRKRERDEPLLKLDHEEDPENPFKMFNPGMTHHYLAEHEKAIEWLAKCIAASAANESQLRKAYALMGFSQRELGQLDAALSTFETGLQVVPEDPELLFQSASVLASLGRIAEAKARYLQVKPDISGHFSSVDTGILTFKRYHNLAMLEMGEGNYAQALQWWRQALEAAPNFSPSAAEMFEAALAHRDFRVASEALNALFRAEGPSEGWAQRSLRFAGESGRDPDLELRQILDAYPYAIGPLLILARGLLARGDHGSAQPVLDLLERLGSAEGAFLAGMSALGRLDLWGALTHMSRAQELNPWHEPTLQHLLEIRRVLSQGIPAALGLSGKEVLRGSHVGKLGVADKGVSVVIVTFNSARTTPECLERVLSTTEPIDEVIVVDNASSDGTRSLLEEFSAGDSRVQVILNPENVGYSRAANQGMLASKGEFIVTLNPDAYVEPLWT